MKTTRRVVTATAAAALLGTAALGANAAPVAAGASTAPAAASVTGQVAAGALVAASTGSSENSKLDKVATPRLGWFSCYDTAKCATVKLPLDYDNPKGATTDVAVLRLPATGRRIGTLFVNPGGPGGSSTAMAYFSDSWLSPEVREKFDVVGVDPRGIGFSDNVRCLTVEQQGEVMERLNVPFPYGYTQEQRYMNAAKKVARACSTNSLATSMSTAEVARDMEMVRRGIGDGKLSYIGFSYGSQLGTTYANMFPTNFRSIVVDGTLDPAAWSGTSYNQSKPLEQRLRSGEGAWKALRKILDECEKAGPGRCSFADGGDTRARFDALMARLKKGPVTVADPDTGEPLTITYADVVGDLLNGLYAPYAPEYVDYALSYFDRLTSGETSRMRATAADRRFEKRLLDSLRNGPKRPTKEFPYENSYDAFLSVTCTDSRETTRLADYPSYVKAYDAKAPHFGRVWMWNTAGCAGDSFTGQDEDAYVGPYDRPTTKAVLVVGNYWDPATAYTGAVAAKNRLGRARLISSDSWGHTAYGVSGCVTARVNRYLIEGTAPLNDATCPAESELFPARPDEEPKETAPEIAKTHKLPRMADKSRAFPAPTVVR